MLELIQYVNASNLVVKWKKELNTFLKGGPIQTGLS